MKIDRLIDEEKVTFKEAKEGGLLEYLCFDTESDYQKILLNPSASSTMHFLYLNDKTKERGGYYLLLFNDQERIEKNWEEYDEDLKKCLRSFIYDYQDQDLEFLSSKELFKRWKHLKATSI